MLARVFASMGDAAARAFRHLVSHPKVLAVLGVCVLGALVGIAITSLSALTGPMRLLFVLIYLFTLVAAVFSRDRVVSKRLWISILAATMGLLAFRVIYGAINLPAGTLRSTCTGIFGLVCGITSFLKVRS